MSEFLEHAMKVIGVADKFKRAMQKKGIRRARVVCPDCPDKYITGSLNGKKDHLHMGCECGKIAMME